MLVTKKDGRPSEGPRRLPRRASFRAITSCALTCSSVMIRSVDLEPERLISSWSGRGAEHLPPPGEERGGASGNGGGPIFYRRREQASGMAQGWQ